MQTKPVSALRIGLSALSIVTPGWNLACMAIGGLAYRLSGLYKSDPTREQLHAIITQAPVVISELAVEYVTKTVTRIRQTYTDARTLQTQRMLVSHIVTTLEGEGLAVDSARYSIDTIVIETDADQLEDPAAREIYRDAWADILHTFSTAVALTNLKVIPCRPLDREWAKLHNVGMWTEEYRRPTCTSCGTVFPTRPYFTNAVQHEVMRSALTAERARICRKCQISPFVNDIVGSKGTAEPPVVHVEDQPPPEDQYGHRRVAIPDMQMQIESP